MSKTIDESMHLSKSAAAEEVTALESSFDSHKCALDLDFKTAWKPSSRSGGNGNGDNSTDFNLPAVSNDSKVQSTQATKP